jgi:hypothetical protein
MIWAKNIGAPTPRWVRGEVLKPLLKIIGELLSNGDSTILFADIPAGDQFIEDAV